MAILGVISQIRTTNLQESINFYVNTLGMEQDFIYEDFYAGIKAGAQCFHIKLVDKADPSIEYVAREDHFHLYFSTDNIDELYDRYRQSGVTFSRPLTDTPWGTREFVVADPQGNILYFAQNS